jgi:hypothetical protein
MTSADNPENATPEISVTSVGVGFRCLRAARTRRPSSKQRGAGRETAQLVDSHLRPPAARLQPIAGIAIADNLIRPGGGACRVRRQPDQLVALRGSCLLRDDRLCCFDWPTWL